MTSPIRTSLDFIDQSLFRWMVKFLWPQYQRPRKGYQAHYRVIKRYFFHQKVLRINGKVPWPVDFRSKIFGAEHITKGVCCDPGDNIGVYINAYGGIILGDNVNIGPNSILTSTNHDQYDHRKLSKTKGITIGNNVWIGGNCSILAGSSIGDNVTIGAGCVIHGDIPSNTLVIQDKAQLKFVKKLGPYQWNSSEEKLT